MLNGKRIFVFEDDAFNLAIIRVPLRRAGATVLFDRWGHEAEALVRDALPLDLIILDLMYPGSLTGYDIYEQIRRIPDLENVPVVAVTAADPDTEMPRTQQKGFAGFISKPLPARFVDFINDVLNGKEVWEAD